MNAPESFFIVHVHVLIILVEKLVDQPSYWMFYHGNDLPSSEVTSF